MSAAPPNPQARLLRPVLSLVLLTGINLFNYLDRYVLAAVLGPLKTDFALTDEQLGRTSTAFMLGYFLTSPVFGYLGDRFSRKWLSAGGVFVWSVGTVLTGFSSSYAALLACRILIGLGEASYAALAPGWLADLFSKERRNNAQTVFCVAVPVGSALGYLVGGYLAARHGWRSAFYVAGAPGLLLALGLLGLKEPARGATENEEGGTATTTTAPAGSGLSRMLGLFRLEDYRLVLLGYTAYTFALGAFGFWGPQFLVRAHGMAEERASGFFGAMLVGCGLVGTLVGGFAASAWQRRTRAGYALTMALSAVVGTPLAFGAFMVPTLNGAMVFLALAMFALFLPTGPINTLILESVPVALRASAMALSIFTIHLFGDIWSPQIVGWLTDKFGDIRHAILLLPAMLAVCAGFWLWLAVRKLRSSV